MTMVGFGGNRAAHVPDKAFLEIINGQVEPSGLLPFQMPAGMETVECGHPRPVRQSRRRPLHRDPSLRDHGRGVRSRTGIRLRMS